MSRAPRLFSFFACFALTLVLSLAPATGGVRGKGGGKPPPPPPPAGSPAAMLAAIDMGYVQEITTHLTTIGANPNGLSRIRNARGSGDRELPRRRDADTRPQPGEGRTHEG